MRSISDHQARQKACIASPARPWSISSKNMRHENAKVSVLAVKIADALMDNGLKIKARRLQLRGPNEEDLGGRDRQCVVKTIEQVITSNSEQNATDSN